MHDLNGDGALDASELEQIYHSDQGSSSSDDSESAKQAVRSFLEMADSDHDGKVSFAEFKSSLDLPYEPENFDSDDDAQIPLNFQESSA